MKMKRSSRRSGQPLLTIGDKVTWESQAGGSTTKKEGTVVATQLAHDLYGRPVRVAMEKFPGHRRMFDGWEWERDGVLVEVRDGKTARAKPKLYMPRLSTLNKT